MALSLTLKLAHHYLFLAIYEQTKAIIRTKIGELKKLIDEYLEFIDSDDYYEDNDNPHYIFEAAINAFYPQEVWDYINKNG